MPRVRKGPGGPRSSLAGKSGTNKPATPPKGSSGSGKTPRMTTQKRGY